MTNSDLLEKGSKVYVYHNGILCEHVIYEIYIHKNIDNELECIVMTNVYNKEGKIDHSDKMTVDEFMDGVKAAWDMKISDIRIY